MWGPNLLDAGITRWQRGSGPCGLLLFTVIFLAFGFVEPLFILAISIGVSEALHCSRLFRLAPTATSSLFKPLIRRDCRWVFLSSVNEYCCFG